MIAPVGIDPRARRAWPALRGIRCAFPGDIIVGLGGEVLRVREDGGAEEVNAVPLRRSIAADPCPGRRAA